MKALRTLVLDEVYELLTSRPGKILAMGVDSEGADVQAEVVLVRRNEGRVELRFYCTAVLDGGLKNSNVELVVKVEKASL